MSDESDLLSRFLDVEQLLKTDTRESNGTSVVDHSTNQWYAAGTGQWYGPHLANHFAPIQIIPYQQLMSSGIAETVANGNRQYQATVNVNSGVAHPRYLYVLNAPTSSATKLTEEPITFLNQGQSYEIQLICHENPSNISRFKSEVRVSFNDRRLQFMEKEQLESWKLERHPTEKLVELDIPLCYGVTGVKGEVGSLNSAEFLWDCGHKTAVSVRLNCVSTEFTMKKCGGEKGIPFRLQINTYEEGRQQGSSPRLLHSAYCQVKVFKPKGAERKLKNDAEWMNRLPPENKKDYWPSQDKTLMTEIGVEEFSKPLSGGNSSAKHMNFLYQNYLQNPSISTTDLHSPGLNSNSTEVRSVQPTADLKLGSNSAAHNIKLTSHMTQLEVVQWMKLNQFDNFIDVLSRFTGADLLRLSRKDFIEICGLAEGIRFSNAIRNRPIRPKISIFVSIQTPAEHENGAVSRNELQLERHGSLDSFALSPGNSAASSPSTTGTSMTRCSAYGSPSPSPLASSFPSSLDSDNTVFLAAASLLRKRPLDRGEDFGDAAGGPLKRCCSQLNFAAYKNVYSLVTLDYLTRAHLMERLSCLCGLHPSQIHDIYMQNSRNIIVEVTNLVIENFEDESYFELELLPVDDSGSNLRCVLLLKTVPNSLRHRLIP